ncbi:MAG: PIN domain-containing protein [Acidobacteriota bacterium]|nr:PIN domain-containing protein [Acidobacteriota bacterium]
MKKALLDTDIFSEILKAKDQRVAAAAKAYHSIFNRYSISTITVMEIVKGFHKMRREDRLQIVLANLDSLEIIPLDRESGILAGRIYADLERTGQPIGRADPMIAGIAIAGNLTLISGNTAHFQRIIDIGYPLDLGNWRGNN